MNWYLVAFNKYDDFSGRARRKEFFNFIGLNILISIGLAILDSVLGLKLIRSEFIDYGPLYLIFQILIFLPTTSCAVRRIHDTGRSGWFYLLALIPIVGTIRLLIIFFEDSENNENQYGPNPKEESVISSNLQNSSTPYTGGGDSIRKQNMQNPIEMTGDFLFDNCIELINQGNIIEAEKLIGKGIILEPENILYKKLILLIEDKVKESKECSLLYDKSEEAYKRKDYELALSLIDQLITKDMHPNNMELRESILLEMNKSVTVKNTIQAIEEYLKDANYIMAEEKLQSLDEEQRGSSYLSKIEKVVFEERAKEELEWVNFYIDKKKRNQAIHHLEKYLHYCPNDIERKELKNKLQNQSVKYIFKLIVSIIITLIIVVIGISFYNEYKQRNEKETNDFNYAIASNNQEILRNFMVLYPNSEYTDKLNKILKELNETDSIDWVSARLQNTSVAYLAYIEKYKAGIFVDIAKKNHDSILLSKITLEMTVYELDNIKKSLLDSGYILKLEEIVSNAISAQLNNEEYDKTLKLINQYFYALSTKNYMEVVDLISPSPVKYLNLRKTSRGEILNFHQNNNAFDKEEYKTENERMIAKKSNKEISVSLLVDYYGITEYPPEKLYENRQYIILLDEFGEISSLEFSTNTRNIIR